MPLCEEYGICDYDKCLVLHRPEKTMTLQEECDLFPKGDWESTEAAQEYLYPESEDTCQNICDQRVPQLYRKRDTAGLLTLFGETVRYVPERWLVEVTFLALQLSQQTDDDAARPAAVALLNHTLSREFTAAEMLKPLRQRSLDEVLCLMRVLMKRIHDADIEEYHVCGLVSWVKVLLDAHYTVLVMSSDPEVAALVEQLIRWTDIEEALTAESSETMRLIDQLKTSTKDPTSAAPKSAYSVETLCL